MKKEHNLNSKHNIATNINENFCQTVMDMLIPHKFSVFLIENVWLWYKNIEIL